MQTTNIKCLILGAVCAIAAVLAGEGLAHAADQEDITRSEQAALDDSFEGTARGLDCEVIRLADGTFEAQCDDPSDRAVIACDAFVDATYTAEVDSETRHYMYEACMTIALHTPGAVR